MPSCWSCSTRRASAPAGSSDRARPAGGARRGAGPRTGRTAIGYSARFSDLRDAGRGYQQARIALSVTETVAARESPAGWEDMGAYGLVVRAAATPDAAELAPPGRAQAARKRHQGGARPHARGVPGQRLRQQAHGGRALLAPGEPLLPSAARRGDLRPEPQARQPIASPCTRACSSRVSSALHGKLRPHARARARRPRPAAPPRRPRATGRCRPPCARRRCGCARGSRASRTRRARSARGGSGRTARRRCAARPRRSRSGPSMKQRTNSEPKPPTTAGTPDARGDLRQPAAHPLAEREDVLVDACRPRAARSWRAPASTATALPL